MVGLGVKNGIHDEKHTLPDESGGGGTCGTP